MASPRSGAAAARFSPVKALQDQVVALDAAMLVCVTSAEVGAVHRLRTSTRRVEAQILLLELLHAGEGALPLPEHAEELAEVRKHLRRVRRAAGAVRDLDVQSDGIWFDAPAKTAVHKGTPGDLVRKQAKKLRKHLQKQREYEAAKLIAVLRDQQEPLAAALSALEEKLKPAARKTAPAAAVLARAQAWFGRQVHPLLKLKPREGEQPADTLRRAVEALDDESIHSVRKAAKLCRYLCESEQGAATQTAAQRFEAMQEAAGKWHDWLLLEQLAHSVLGKKEPLTRRYATHRDAALAECQLRLAELLPTTLPLTSS